MMDTLGKAEVRGSLSPKSVNPQIYRVHAFTANPREGNPAGVVPQAAQLDDHQMQAVATFMGLSETAFVFPSRQPRCLFQLRWFTPTIEVRLCGHATVATLKVLVALNLFPAEGRSAHIETLTGILQVRVEKTREGQFHWLEIPPPDFQEVTLDTDQLRKIFNLRTRDLHLGLPAVRDKSDGDLYIPVCGIEVLKRLEPNFDRMRTSKRWGATCFFTPETFELQNRWHCRYFAPAYGVDEDPVTGAINGPLGAYHRIYAQLDEPDEIEYVGEQGDLIGHQGRVRVRVRAKGKIINSLEIGGEAVIVSKMPLSSVMGV